MHITESLRLMAREVMLRAFRDLKAHSPEVREDAVNFLTASSPEWANSLETWCAFANLDPNLVGQRTVTYLKEGSFTHA